MPSLSDLASIPRLLTQAELQSLLGQPHPPCPVCGCAAFSISARGEWICWGCDWDRAHADRGIALRVRILSHGGQPIAVDEDGLAHQRRRREAAHALGVILIEIEGVQEWMLWEAGGWCYAACTFDLPAETLAVWVRRTQHPTFNPDREEFWRGTPIPDSHDGAFAAWWPREED